MQKVPRPIPVGVKETVQAVWFELIEATLHGLGRPKKPGPSLENVTWPVGLVAPDAAVSVTVAVQIVDWPTATGLGAHDTLVLVGSTVTVCVTVAP